MRPDVAPRRMDSPNVLRIVDFSSSPRTLELYIRMESMCRIPNGGGAMKPSCSPMTSASSVPGRPSSPARVDSRRAVILKNGPNVVVSIARPRFFAAAAISSLVTIPPVSTDVLVDARAEHRAFLGRCERSLGATPARDAAAVAMCAPRPQK